MDETTSKPEETADLKPQAMMPPKAVIISGFTATKSSTSSAVATVKRNSSVWGQVNDSNFKSVQVTVTSSTSGVTISGVPMTTDIHGQGAIEFIASNNAPLGEVEYDVSATGNDGQHYTKDTVNSPSLSVVVP